MAVGERVGAEIYEGALAFRIVERGAERARAEMPVTAAMLNPFGTVHAGALIWFADVTATVCAVGDPESVGADGKGFPLAVDLHTVLLANERDGVLEAEAVPVRRGGRVIVMRTVVRGAGGRVLIEMTTTHLRAG
ncbi:MAG: PaaI family thioesterase [Pseudomonadota bacterium]